MTISSDQPRRPERHYHYVDRGPAIYLDSFATIRREADLSRVPSSAEKVAVRMIHGSGQVDLVDDLVVHPELVAARAALQAGAPMLCDATMVVKGVTRTRLPADNEVLCMLNEPEVPGLAAAWGTTRTAAAVSLWEPHLEGRSSPSATPPPRSSTCWRCSSTAHRARRRSSRCPVGFIGAAESKQALEEFHAVHGIDIPFVTVRGRRGGSAMTSSALNALAQEQE